MGFRVVNVEQRTPEWFAARAGRLTGSRAKDAIAFSKTKPNEELAARRDYRLELACERLTGGIQEDGFTSDAMQRGIDCEPLAFAAYESKTGRMVERSGFLAHDTHMAGVSLDGHMDGFKGILELKCPKSSTHLRYIRDGKVPAEHLAQITHALWVTGAEWCDFMSFDDRLPVELSTFLVTVRREEVGLKAYEESALKFLAEVDAEVAEINKLRSVA